MTRTNNSKRALVMSGIVLVVCISLLVGSTFAWFTDSVTSGVNTIRSGNLDIVLEYKDANGDWQDAEGQTLDFKTADNRAEILWEPGCTYELPAIRVRNNGTLALKYEIMINGINGSAKLLEAIEFTANDDDIAAFEGHLDATNAVSQEIVIKGHMKEGADNDYQGLTASGIGITVFATQYTYEKDSYGDQYDVNAPFATQAQINDLAKKLSEAPAGSTVYLEALNYRLLSLGSGAYSYDYPANLTLEGKEGTAFTGFSVNNETIAGWTFKNIDFIGDPDDNEGNTDGIYFADVSKVSDLTFDGCTFTNGAKLSMIKTSGVRTENVTIKNCTFTENIEEDTPSILLQGVTNITIDKCTFVNAGYNAIQTNKTKGEFVFTDNSVTNTVDRAIRVSNQGANITVTGNTIVSDGDDNGELLKVSGTSGTITINGNTWNGLTDSEVSAGMVGSDYIIK